VNHDMPKQAIHCEPLSWPVFEVHSALQVAVGQRGKVGQRAPLHQQPTVQQRFESETGEIGAAVPQCRNGILDSLVLANVAVNPTVLDVWNVKTRGL
jgi:hypothetical protein